MDARAHSVGKWRLLISGVRPVEWFLFFVGALCGVAAVVLFAVLWWPPPRAQLTVTAPISEQQKQVEQIYRQYIESRNRADVVGMRALTCSTPSGNVAKGLEILESGDSLPVRVDRVEGFVNYSEIGVGKVRIDGVHRVSALTDEGRALLKSQEDGDGFQTGKATLVNEGGWKMCGGAV
ncbi:hypothetical protein [Mycobacteroides abscessus]|uniref:hypothetical protein n=1 Tax=Mycobacteroides abscessus TaxID=36809 RepID=UPI0019D17077|nr:hypothetical protein [Mycobacteroides abscessus]MBN7482861.1 hypothetical protein [Mycobacteroides abscessus subsp. massiliense]